MFEKSVQDRVMERETNRTKWLHVRLSEEEYARLTAAFKLSNCNKFSDYLRRVVFQKPLVKTYRNASMDGFVAEMVRLINELNSIGNNFNQVVKKINTYKDEKTIYQLLITSELDRRELLKHIETIRDFIEKNAAKW